MLEILKEWIQPYLDGVAPYAEETQEAFKDYAYLQAAFVAAMGYLLARLLVRYIPEMLRSLLARFSVAADEGIIALTRFPLFNLIFLAGLVLAVQVSGLHESVAFALKAVLKSTMIAVVAIFVYQLAKKLLDLIAHRSNKRGIIQPQTVPLFSNVVLVFVLVGAIHQIFSVWNVDMTALLASAGIAGLAIGMAAKDMLSDVIAGILILTDRPYRVNDVIWVKNDRSIVGIVTRIGIRSTRIVTDNNLEIIIPNSVMGHSQIMNETSADGTLFRINIEVDIAYGVDPERLRSLLLDISRNHPRIMQDKPQAVHLMKFNSSSVTFRLVFWILDADTQFTIRNSVREILYKRLVEENIPLLLPNQEEVAITHLPDSRQEVAITHLPDSRQEVHIKEMPDSSRTIYVKEVPDLFGSRTVKHDTSQAPGQRKVKERSYKAEDEFGREGAA